MPFPEQTGGEWRKLLVATDFSPWAARAHQCAVQIALSCGAEVYIAHVISPQAFAYFGEAESKQAEQRAREEVSKNLEQWRSAGIQRLRLHLHIAKGRPAAEISALVERENVGVAVLGTRGSNQGEKFLLGAVAEEVFRTASFPLLTVGLPETEERGKPWEARRILYACNFTPYSEYAARYAFLLAELTQGRLTMMHVVETDETFHSRNENLLRDFFKARLLRTVPYPHGLAQEPEVVSAFGVADEQILETARRTEADLIVLGVRAPQKTAGYLPSRTAYRVVCRAACPVLTVPQPLVRPL